MTEYALTRAQSTAVIRGSAIDNQPTLMVYFMLFCVCNLTNLLQLTRTYSVPDVNAYHRFTDPYKPQWCIYRYPFPQYKQYFPYRYYRDNYLVVKKSLSTKISLFSSFRQKIQTLMLFGTTNTTVLLLFIIEADSEGYFTTGKIGFVFLSMFELSPFWTIRKTFGTF